jgi:hypothetical protein
VTKIKYILFLLILLLLIAPSVQKELNIFHLKPLGGAVSYEEQPALTKSGWFSGEFQVSFDDYLEQHIGFRPDLVRLNNQLDYSLFRKPSAKGIIVGVGDFLYEVWYILAYTGKDFAGEDKIIEKSEKIKFLQDSLKSYGVHLIPIFSPGKGSLYPENIPERFHPEKRSQTNIDTYRAQFSKLNVKYLDLNSWFKVIKDTTSYPLYAQTGTHWTEYGVMLALDTLLRFIEDDRGKLLTDISITGFEITDKLRGDDYDIAAGMNLVCEIPHYEMAYPKVSFYSDSTTYKPRVMTISDSYYWMIYGPGHTEKIFGQNIFRYYNQQDFAKSYSGAKPVMEYNIEKEFGQYDYIFLWYTDGTLPKFAGGYVDNAHFLLSNLDEIKQIEQSLIQDRSRLKVLQEEAMKEEVGLDDKLREEALNILRKENTENIN